MDTGYLYLGIIKNISVLALAMYLVTQMKAFRRALNQSSYSMRDKCILIAVFGCFSAAGNYLNVPLGEALAHTRLVGTIVGGLFGGPVVGIGAGLIGAIGRYFIPVSSPEVVWAAMVANVLIGGLSGWVCQHYGARKITVQGAVVTAIVSELILKGTVLGFSTPRYVFELELGIAVPAALSTCFGVALAVYIIRDVFLEEDRLQAQAAQKVIQGILQARGIFRNHGLNPNSAHKAADIIYHTIQADSVVIRNNDGELTRIQNKENLQDDGANCLDLPIQVSGKVVGQILIYRFSKTIFLPYERELLQGMVAFFGMELLQEEFDEKIMLLSQAEYNILKSQIRPHFLFNMLGNIRAVINIDPHKARQLVSDLAYFLRSRLQSGREEISLEEELEGVDTYIRLEQARFGERIKVERQIDEDTLQCAVPVFSIQVLVENSIKHGLSPKKEGGTIYIRSWQDRNMLFLSVADNGVGITPENLQILKQMDYVLFNSVNSTGIGLKNVYSRMKALYGENCVFKLESTENVGTMAAFGIPWMKEEDNDEER